MIIKYFCICTLGSILWQAAITGCPSSVNDLDKSLVVVAAGQGGEVGLIQYINGW